MSNALAVSTAEFLSAFFPDEEEKICIRRIEAKGAPKTFGKHNGVTTRRQLASGEATRGQLEKLNEQNGLYFLVNSGGQEDEDITRFNAFFVENDDLSIEGQHALLSAAPLQPSIRVETKKSVHAYWLVEGGCAKDEWRDIQERLIAFFKSDGRIKNPARCMRLPGFNHVAYNAEDKSFSYKMVEVVEFDPNRRYTAEAMRKAFPPAPVNEEKRWAKRDLPIPPSPGNSSFYSHEELTDELKRRVMLAGKKNKYGNYDMRCPAHYGESETSLFYSPETDVVDCLAGCSHVELLRAFGLPEQPKVIGLKMGGKSTRKPNVEEGGKEILEEGKEDVGQGLPLEQELDVCMADVEPQEVEWLIEPYIPLGKLTIVEGDPDEGKSFAMLAIAAALTIGDGLPFGDLAEPGNVILLSAEDGRADTIRPRLDSLGADIRRVFAVTVPLVLNDKGFEQLEHLVKLREAKLVLFDPVFAYVGGQADINQDNKVRAITSRLADIAERYNCAIIALRHLPKAQQRSAKMAGMSSVAWTASARSVLLFGHDPEDEQTRGFVHTKHNLSRKGAAQGYRIEDVGGSPFFRWTGESDLTAEKILYSQATCGDTSKLENAEDFLYDTLQGGAVQQQEIDRRANKARISNATLRRAKTKLQVKSGRLNAKSSWFWKLPEDSWPWEESKTQEQDSDVQTGWKSDEHVEFQGSNLTSTTFRPDVQA
jgi:hypothetical protein